LILHETYVSCAVEGDLDEAVLRRVLEDAGIGMGKVYGRNGKTSLLRNLQGFNHAAEHSPWVVLLDLAFDADCAPAFISRYLPAPATNMYLRVAVREIESWIIADRDRLAQRLAIPAGTIPVSPDDLNDPKDALVNLARHSRRSTIRQDIVPSLGSRSAVGPGYNSVFIDFVSDRQGGWRPSVAASNSASLARCLQRLRSLRAG
jgi:hypothetical protein